MEADQQEEYQEPYPAQQHVVMGHTSEGALQYQLESQEIIERVEHILNGEVEQLNPKINKVEWVRKRTPMVNEKGINMILGYLTIYVGGTKTYALSDLDAEYIQNEVIDIGRNIKAELYDNWNEYEVHNTSVASYIINIVCSSVYAVLKKGENANYLNFLRTTQNIQDVTHHQHIQQAPQQKKSFMDSLMARVK